MPEHSKIASVAIVRLGCYVNLLTLTHISSETNVEEVEVTRFARYVKPAPARDVISQPLSATEQVVDEPDVETIERMAMPSASAMHGLLM